MRALSWGKTGWNRVSVRTQCPGTSSSSRRASGPALRCVCISCCDVAAIYMAQGNDVSHLRHCYSFSCVLLTCTRRYPSFGQCAPPLIVASEIDERTLKRQARAMNSTTGAYLLCTRFMLGLFLLANRGYIQHNQLVFMS